MLHIYSFNIRTAEPLLLALVEVLTSDEIKQFIEDTYAGAVVPLF